MLGLGAQEVLVLLLLGGVLAGIVLLAVLLLRAVVGRAGSGRIDKLEEDVRQLRKELDRRDGE